MFWMIVIAIASTLVQLALSYYLRPKVQKRGPGELQAPFAEQGHPIAYVAGCVKKRGVNVVWQGQTAAIGKKDNQVYDYYASLMLAICQGPVDRIRRVWFGQDALANATVLYSRGSGFQVHNRVNLEAITSVLHPPFPTGDMEDVGNQDAHIGVVAMPATGATNEWIHPAYRTGAPMEWIPRNRFVVYVKFRRGLTYEEYTARGDGANSVEAYQWQEVAPYLGDTIYKDGAFSRWDGYGWKAEDPSLTPAKEHWKIGLRSKEKGVDTNGAMVWYEGAPDQPIDPFLQIMARGSSLSAPSYGGLCYAVFAPHFLPANLHSWEAGAEDGVVAAMGEKGFYWGESAVIPEVAFEVQRIPDPLNLRLDVPAKHVPSSTLAPYLDGPRLVAEGDPRLCKDANPANVLYEWLTSPSMGIGVPVADVDTVSFQDAGRILYYEGVGVSFDVDQQASFDDVAKEILMVTDGVLFEDPTTGAWTFRLIREPISNTVAATWGLAGSFYTRTDWLVFGEDDFEGKPEFTRGSWGDVANQIKIQFTDRNEGYAQRVVDVQDVANYQTQGELVTIQNTYNSVCNRDLAMRLAYRDLRTSGYPHARLKDRMNRRGWSLRPGDCFVVNRPTLGISNMRFRLLSIRYGTLQDGGIEFEAVEDVFGMPDTVYSEPGTGWVDPSTIPPVPPAAVRAWELAYDVTRDGPRVGFTALVARGDPNTTSAILWTSANGRDLTRVGEIGYTPCGFTSAALALEEHTESIQLQGLTDPAAFLDLGTATDGENLVLIDNELISFEGVGTNTDGTIYLAQCYRGVLDTIPRAHGLASRAWLIHRPTPVQAAKTTADHNEMFAIQAANSGGETEIIGAPIYGGMTSSRELRPIVPGRHRVGAAGDLASSLVDLIQVGPLGVSWKTRNRLTQAPGAVAQDETTIPPEAGQLTRVSLLHGASRLFPLAMADGLAPRFGGAITIGEAANWTTVRGSTFYVANGIGQYPDVLLAAPANGTWFVGINMDSFQVAQVASRPANWVDLYQAQFSGSGATRVVGITDLRTSTTLRTADTAAEADMIEVADLAGPAKSVLPFHHRITAVRGGLESLEARETGELFAAGIGLNIGNFMGGI